MNQFVNDFSLSKIEFYHRYTLNPSYVFNGHSHNSWELNVVLDGALEITYDTFVFRLNKNQAFLSEPNIFHRNKVIENTCANMVVIHFLSSDLPRLALPKIYEVNALQLDLLHYAIKDIEIFLDAQKIPCGEMSILPFSFKKIIEIFLSKITQDARPLIYTKNKDTHIYNKAVQHMKANLSSGCSLSELTAICCVSESKLKQVFKAYTGHGPMTYYNHIRLEYGRQLLTDNHSIADVSARLGYSSQSYFSRVFKKKYHQSPLAFQQTRHSFIL